MTSTLALPETAAPSPAPTQANTAAAALAAGHATAFVRGQSTWLQRGVDRAGDGMIVDLVLQAHDRSHDRWLAVIAHVHRHVGAEAAAVLADLYAYFGRVAGSLDSGGIALLDPPVATQVRQLVASRLSDVTERAVDAVWELAAAV